MKGVEEDRVDRDSEKYFVVECREDFGKYSSYMECHSQDKHLTNNDHKLQESLKNVDNDLNKLKVMNFDEMFRVVVKFDEEVIYFDVEMIYYVVEEICCVVEVNEEEINSDEVYLVYEEVIYFDVMMIYDGVEEICFVVEVNENEICYDEKVMEVYFVFDEVKYSDVMISCFDEEVIYYDEQVICCDVEVIDFDVKMVCLNVVEIYLYLFVEKLYLDVKEM